MHTSTMLRAEDFTYRSVASPAPGVTDFQTFCPGYHPLDRVGVVSISRLFWPESFHVRRLLATRLKTVYYYDTTAPTIAIAATAPVEALVLRSFQRLPPEVRGRYTPQPALPDGRPRRLSPRGKLPPGER